MPLESTAGAQHPELHSEPVVHRHSCPWTTPLAMHALPPLVRGAQQGESVGHWELSVHEVAQE